MHAMNADPSTWPQPDAVDTLQAYERFEESEHYRDAVREWMADDGPTFDFAADRFCTTNRYEVEFAKWMEAGRP